MIYVVTNQPRLFNDLEDIEYRDLDFCIQYFKNIKYIGLDTETTGFSPHSNKLLLVQLGTFDDQFVIDNSIDYTLLKPLLEDNSKVFLLHNAKFDLRFFYKLGVIPTNIYDSYLAEKLLYLGYPSGVHLNSLTACTERYLEVKLQKEIRGAIHREGNSERVIRYAAEDVKYLGLIMNKQMELIKEKQLVRALKLECGFVKVLAYIEYCGIYLDKNKWLQKMENDKNILDSYHKQLNEWVLQYGDQRFIDNDKQGDLFLGFPKPKCGINWSSPQQVIEFFKSLGLNLLVKDKETGLMKDSVEANVLLPQKNKSSIIPIYLDYKQAEKVVSTYGQTFIDAINPLTGRIHSQFNQLMDTTRLSCGGEDKNTKVKYINLQNIPSDSETRSCFTSIKNSVLIDCDYTAQEDLVFTELSREPKLIEFYNSKEKRDGHSFVAKMCFPELLNSVSEQEVKKQFPELRAQAKTAKFAIHYGGNGQTVARNLNLSVEQGNRIEQAYLKAFPQIKNYFDDIKRQTYEQGYVLLSKVTGHKRFIYDINDLKELEKSFTPEFWNIYRKEKLNQTSYFLDVLKPKVSTYFSKKGDLDRIALNTPVQGTSAQITKLAGIYFFDYLMKHNLVFKVLIVNCVHDEYVVETPKELSKEISLALQNSMEKAGKVFTSVVTLKAIPEISTYWKH